MNRNRGLAIGKEEDVEHAHRITFEVVSGTIQHNGGIHSASVRFIDKNEIELYAFPILFFPSIPFKQSAMLLINKITENDDRIRSVAIVSILEVKNLANGEDSEFCKIIATHFENRNTPDITTDLLYHLLQDNRLVPCQNDIYNELKKHNLDTVFPVFGFFDKPEIEIDDKTWDDINNNLIRLHQLIRQKHTKGGVKDLAEMQLLFKQIYERLNKIINRNS